MRRKKRASNARKTPSVLGRFTSLLAGFIGLIGVLHYTLITVGPAYL